MNCQVERYKSYSAPTFAGNLRFLTVLLLLIAGAYLATLSDFKGHGLGFLLIFTLPFLIFKDGK